MISAVPQQAAGRYKIVTIAAAVFTCVAATWTLYAVDPKWALFIISGLLFPFAAVMIRDFRRLLLVLLMFVMPLNADVNFMMHPSVGGADAFTFGLVDILLFALLIVTLLRSASAKEVGVLRFYPAIMIPSLVLLGFYVISLLAAQDLLWSGFDIFNFVKTLLFFWVLANNIRERRDLNLVIGFALLGLLVQNILVYWQAANPSASHVLQTIGLGAPAELSRFEMQASDLSRPGGTIGHCNHYARYVGLLVPLAIVYALTKIKKSKAFFYTLIAVSSVFALIITLTRSSWIGLVASVMVMIPLLFLRHHFSFRVLRNLGFAALIFLTVLAIYSKPLVHRMAVDDHGSAYSRITTAKVALRMIQDHPVIGIGINNYAAQLPDYWIAEDAFTRKTAVHNTFLLYAAELGILGFGAYLWVLIAFFMRLVQSVQSRLPYVSLTGIGILGGYVAYMVTGLTDKSFKRILHCCWCSGTDGGQ
ncbi:MAG: O-antigen ligase family protein [candidate division KSB1 bacterium]|nr:O-antigen ligase family protein [candidate division KSB1 bacterium]